MPTVEKTRGGRVFVRGIGEFAVGDQAAVSAGDAEYLVEERGDFEVVDDDPATDTADTHDESDGASDSTDDSADDAASDDADTTVDADGEFDVDDWLDQDYQERADSVRDGAVDAHLDEIEASETSQTVTDAVADRRDDLEG